MEAFVWTMVVVNGVAALCNVFLLAADPERKIPIVRATGAMLSVGVVIWGIVLLVAQ